MACRKCDAMKKTVTYIMIVCSIFLCCGCAKEENVIGDFKETSQYINVEKQTETYSDNPVEEADSTLTEENMVDGKEESEEDNTVNEKPVVDIDSAVQIEQNDNENSAESISDELVMSLNSSEVDQNSLSNVTVTITNNSELDIISGDEYTLQKYVGAEWESIPLALAWNDLGISIASGQSYDFVYNLSNVYTFENDMTYRIIKKVYMNQIEYILYVDFAVKQS